MTRDELKQEVWDSLPRFRRSLAGRDRVDALVDAAIKHFPDAELHAGRNDFAANWERRMKTQEVGFGPIFWLIVSPLIQVALHKLVDWWFSKSANRVLVSGWKKELRS